MYSGFNSHPGQVLTNARLNIRKGAPMRTAPLVTRVEPETLLRVIGLGRGESVSGNDIWYAGEAETFFWSGGCASFSSGTTGAAGGAAGVAAGAGAAATLAVNRRSNGTILPLTDSGLKSVFGLFSYTEQAGGRIKITGGWENTNIISLPTPLLTDLDYPSIRIHTKAAAAITAVLASIAAAGLTDKLLTCAGTFVPRHKGWDVTRGLSSHSWGVAIDFNVSWNGYGVAPASIGQMGSVRELVPLFAAEGFAWGGDFSPPHVDGMHFELARTDL